MDKAKKLIRKLRGKKNYVSSPTGSLPPSPIPGSANDTSDINKNSSGTKLRRGKSLTLNRMWRRCSFYHLKTNPILYYVDYDKEFTKNNILFFAS